MKNTGVPSDLKIVGGNTGKLSTFITSGEAGKAYLATLTESAETLKLLLKNNSKQENIIKKIKENTKKILRKSTK